MNKNIQHLIDHYHKEKLPLAALLAAIEDVQGMIGEGDIALVATAFDLPREDVQAFVNKALYLHTELVGKFEIRFCRGTPCAMQDSADILKAVEDFLTIEVGDITADGQFSLEYTNCLGMCDEGPAMMINDRRYGFLTPKRAVRILQEIKEANTHVHP